MSKYTVKLVEQDEYELWDQLVARSPTGSVFSSSIWLSTIAQLFGRELKIWGVYSANKLVAGTGLVIFRPTPFLKIAGDLPLTPYTPIILQSTECNKKTNNVSQGLIILDLLARVLEKEADIVSITNHPMLTDIRSFCWLGWRSSVRYTYLIDISNIARLWDEVDRNIRKQVRKCQREGVEVEWNVNPKVLYRLYEQTYQKQGRRPYIDEASFCTLCNVWIEENRLITCLAQKDGQAISGCAIVKDYHGIGTGWIAGTDPQYLSLGVASFLQWMAIERLAGEGFQSYDMGGANIASIANFKNQFAGRLTPYYRLQNQNLKAKIYGLTWNKLKKITRHRSS